MQSTHIDTRFFRAGVGTVIYNQAHQVALFERSQHPVGVWQFQQGGVDLGESIEATLWRELQEEVGLTADDFTTVTLLPHWTVYQDENSIEDVTKSRLGQAHRWYFLALKPDREIDLSQATEQASASYKWTTFEEAIAVTDATKQHVYQTLQNYFTDHIAPSEAK